MSHAQKLRDTPLAPPTRALLQGLLALSLVPNLCYLWLSQTGSKATAFEPMISLALGLIPILALPMLALFFLAAQNRQHANLRLACLCIVPALILSSSFNVMALLKWPLRTESSASLLDFEQINLLYRSIGISFVLVFYLSRHRHNIGQSRIWVMPLLLIGSLGTLQLLDMKTAFFSEHLRTMIGIACLTVFFNITTFAKIAWERRSSLVIVLAWGAFLQLSNHLFYLDKNSVLAQTELLLVSHLNSLSAFIILIPHLINEIFRLIHKPVSDIGTSFDPQNPEQKAFQHGLIQARAEILDKLSYEFKTPLNTIIGYSGLLLEQLESSEQNILTDDIYKVNKAGWHMMSLVDEMLDLETLQQHSILLKETSFESKRFMALLENMAKKLADPVATKIRCHQPQDFGMIYADESRLLQVCMNVLRNAIRYTKNGEISIHLYPLKIDQQAYFCIDIRDSGPGMSAEDIKRIFASYEKIQDKSSEALYGFSLGLPITMHLCQMMQGILSIDSKPGMGSTFSLCFLDRTPRALHSKNLPATRAAGTPKLLLVDEDLASNREIQRLLLSVGISSQTVSQARSALRIFIEYQPQIFIIEVHLSSLDGLNLIRSIRMMDSECLIICIGQSYSPEITKQSSDAGANQYFAKPIAVEAIIETMRRTKNIA